MLVKIRRLADDMSSKEFTKLIRDAAREASVAKRDDGHNCAPCTYLSRHGR
jgi:hypothetical protein